jgi:hypothetical protein
MARLVLLSFPSNKAADAFVRMAVENEGTAINTVLPSSATVEWVAARPTRPCECAVKLPSGRNVRRGRRTKGHTDGWHMGRHYGWWLHQCGRVSRMAIDRFAINMIGGNYDLLPEILGDPEREPNDMRQFTLGVDRHGNGKVL